MQEISLDVVLLFPALSAVLVLVILFETLSWTRALHILVIHEIRLENYLPRPNKDSHLIIKEIISSCN